jgi:TetR/AcrR family transcriptional regulator, transcriptional repressor for nem operon
VGSDCTARQSAESAFLPTISSGSNRVGGVRSWPEAALDEVSGVWDEAEILCSIRALPVVTRSGHLQFKDQLVYISAMSHQTPVQLPRGRPRSFDVEAAVERAMGVFWSRGYHATALPDLLRATKLSRGSLYAAFGDKHSLFLRALDRYIADALTRMDTEFDPRREPLNGLRAYLAGYVDRTSGANGRRGCLLVAAAMELAGQDTEVGRRIASFFKAMEARVADALSRAKTAGKLADGVEPSSAARILVCFVEGLRVVGKTAPTRLTSQATADALLDRFIR